jgi:hypothetical protein
MKTIEWTPKRRSRAFGLIQGARHTLFEISRITNIPLGTLGDLKKRNSPLSKVRSERAVKLSDRHKHQIVFHITKNYKSCRLSAISIIPDLQLDVHSDTLKQTLKSLGYNHHITRQYPFLKKLDQKRRLQFARKHAHFTMDDWKAFIWIDEMSIKVGMEQSTKDWI